MLSADGSYLFKVEEFNGSRHDRRVYKRQMWDVRAQRLVWKKQGERVNLYDREPQLIFTRDNVVVSMEVTLDKANWSTGGLRMTDCRTDQLILDYHPNDHRKTDFVFPTWSPVAISADGRLLAAVRKRDIGFGADLSRRNGKVYVWDIKSGRLLWTTQIENLNPDVILFSPDNRSLALGYTDESNEAAPYYPKGKLILRNARNGTLLSTLAEETPQNRLEQTRLIRSAKVESSVKKLMGQKVIVTAAPFLPGDSGPVKVLSFSSDGKLLAAGYSNRSIKIWKVK